MLQDLHVKQGGVIWWGDFRKSLKKNKTVSGQRAKNTKQYKYSQQSSSRRGIP